MKAVQQRAGDVLVEQKIKDSPSDLCPDLVVINKDENKATIVDVTIPFESSPEAFEIARAAKSRK